MEFEPIFGEYFWKYQIMIDAQLKFTPVSYEELLKYYFR